MAFTQIEFYIFMIVTLLSLYLVSDNKIKKHVLIISSFYFYAFFDYRFLLLLLAMTLSTYFAGKMIARSESRNNRKFILCTGILINVAVLFYFKYYNFFIENLNQLFPNEVISFRTISLIVPLGVSFFTFRFISYLVDIYKKDWEGCRQHDIMDFLAYGTFFPIIVSGPIARAKNIIPQLSKIRVNSTNFYNGYRLFVIGLFLKVFIADKIAPYVNFFYENHQFFNSATTWIAVLAYDIQIYCDFSGYSSIAIGISLMLGIAVEENFNFPYAATSIGDFWKRWHITLSEWIRDYLYFPLGGNRKGRLRKYLNLLVAMTLCGFWHGAAWTFILWGLIHGVLLVVNHHWKEYFPRLQSKCLTLIYKFMSWLLTFLSVTVCWILFRSKNTNQAFEILHKIFFFSNVGIAWYNPFVIFIIICTTFFHIAYISAPNKISLPIASKSTSFVLFCLLWLVIVFPPREFQPFVYMQF